MEEKNKKLNELDKLKSDFISTVSHELRTPLAITKEGISIVIDGIPGDINDKQKKVLIIARNNVDRLSRIINDLFNISKIEAGQLELRKTQVSINDLVKQLASSLRLKTKEKGLKLKTDIPKNDINIYIDPDRIIQVFDNLTYNAIKFTEKGSIELSVKDKKNEIECAVKDTGIGISKEDLSKVFQKFQQFDRTPGPGKKGTGLGLAISKGIVELHKGKIWIESELRKGTKFSFVLPKTRDDLIFKEYINNGVKKAIDESSNVSLLVVSFSEFYKLKEEISEQKVDSIMKDLGRVLKNSLRHNTGVVAIRDIGKIAVILLGCNKEGASSVKERIKQIIKNYLSYEKLMDKVKIEHISATYPDEAKTNNELIKKVMN